MGEAAESGRWSTASSLAALVRVPNLFTAPPDVVLGAALAAGAGAAVSLEAVVGLSVASMLLYAGGTTLNDAFDAPSDQTARPERPIPAGDVSRRTGFGLGGLFLLLGIAAAVLAAGVEGGVIAAATGGGILLYDGVLKGGAIGFLTMGAVRGLNVLLGTTAGGNSLPFRWYLPTLVVAAYVTTVTFMAARETTGGNRLAVAVAIAGAGLATLAAGVHLFFAAASPIAVAVGAVLALGFVAWTGSALRAAYLNPVPGTVGPAVGKCVLGIVVLDAAFAAATGVAWAVATAAFLAPAVALSRVFEVT